MNCLNSDSQILTWSANNVIVVPIEGRIYCQNMTANECKEVKLDQISGYDRDPSEPALTVVSVCASPDGKYIAIGTLDGIFMVSVVKNLRNTLSKNRVHLVGRVH